MNSADQQTPASPRQVVLGLFILGQLAFLLVSNGLDWLHYALGNLPDEGNAVVGRIVPGWPEEKGHAWDHSKQLAKGLRGWAEVTGQHQAWSLFAPSVSPVSGFPALQFPDGDLLLSDNEPADPTRYFRVGYFRLRRYEGDLILYLQESEGESPAERAERWERAIERHARDNAERLRAYLRWRASVYHERHPDREPQKQATLVERVYRRAAPDETDVLWHGPITTPLVRWRGDDRPLEWYSPVKQQFVSLER